MTNEEAIRYFKDANNFSYEGVPFDASKYSEAEDIAISALEKQIPKRPKEYKTKFFGDCKTAYDCPNCGHCFTMIKPTEHFIRNQFCDICGQRILWEEDKDA